MNLRRSLLVLAAALLLPACSIYDARYRYQPRPWASEILLPSGQVAARAVGTVIGVRPDPHEDLPAGVEMRMRVLNAGTLELALPIPSFRLVTGDLSALGPPVAVEAAAARVAPGEEAELALLFPFAAGRGTADYDLGGLRMEWSVQIGAQTLPGSVSLERAPYRSHPYWYWNTWFFCAHHGYYHGYWGHPFCTPLYGPGWPPWP